MANAEFWSQFEEVSTEPSMEITPKMEIAPEQAVVDKAPVEEDFFSQFEPSKLSEAEVADSKLMPEGETPKTIAQKAVENIKWQIGPWQTDWEMDDDLAAGLVGAGHMMQDLWRGTKQMMDIDIEEEKANQALINDLYSDPEYGGEAIAGAVVGAVAEPVGFLVPGAKTKTVASMAKQGAMLGFTFGALGYVDEENGQTRIGNAAVGTAVGGTLGAALGKFLIRKPKVPTKEVKVDLETVANFEQEVARVIRSGVTQEDAVKIIKQNAPDLVKDAGEAMKRTGETPDFMATARDYDLIKIEREGGKPIDTIHTLKRGSVLNSVDKYLGLLSTRYKNISKPIFGKIRQFESNIKVRPEALKDRYSLFSDHFESKSGRKNISKSPVFTKAQELDLNYYLLNGKLDEAVKFVEKHRGSEAANSLKEAFKITDELGGEMFKRGIIPKMQKNYWPRVIDLSRMDEFFAEMKKTKVGYDAKAAWKKRLADLEEAAAKKGKVVSEVDKSKAFQRWILKESQDLRTVSLAKGRKIQTVPREWVKFYNSPSYAIDNYIHRAIKEIETAKVFGNSAYKAGVKGSVEGLWNEGDAAEHLFKSRDTEKLWSSLTEDEAKEMRDLLKMRFGNGMTGTKEAVKKYKALINLTMLTNPYSASLQLADLAAPMYKLGVKNAVKGLYKSISQTKSMNKISMEEMGLEKHFAEFEDAMTTGKIWDDVQEKFFRFSGFHAADRLGKEATLNGALSKYADAVKNPNSKAYKQFVDKYSEVFGDSFNDLVMDLRKYNTRGRVKENVTDNIRTLVFNELSDLQPISLSELPQWYLESNAGKMMYTLKSFMLKQMDIVRNDSLYKIRHGSMKEKGEGLANLAKYIYTVGLANMSFQEARRFIAGKENFEDMPDDKALALTYILFLAPAKETFKMIGIDEYLWRDMQQNGLFGGLLLAGAPPAPGSQEMLQGKPEKLTRYIPGVGGMSGRLNEAIGLGQEDTVQKFAEGGVVQQDNPVINNEPPLTAAMEDVPQVPSAELPVVDTPTEPVEAVVETPEEMQARMTASEESKQGMTHTPPEQLGEVGSGMFETIGDVISAAPDVWESMDLVDQLALATAPIPVVGDLMGVGSDINMYVNDPESNTWSNYGLTALGVLPYIPNMSLGVKIVDKGVKRDIEDIITKGKSPFDGREVDVWRGVEAGTIEAAQKGPREIGEHATTNLELANRFALENKGGTGVAGIYKRKEKLEKGVVIPDSEFGYNNAENVSRSLLQHKDFQDKESQDMLFRIQAGYQTQMRKVWDKVDNMNIPEEQKGMVGTKLKKQTAETYGTLVQKFLKNKGYDHVAYINTHEKLPSGDYDASLVLLKPDKWDEIGRTVNVGTKRLYSLSGGKVSKMEPGVYEDQAGKLFQITQDGKIKDMKDITRDFKL